MQRVGSTRIVGLALFAILLTAVLPAAAAPPFDPRSEGLKRALAQGGADQTQQIIIVLRELESTQSESARRSAIQSRQERVMNRLPAGRFDLRHRYRALRGLSGRAHPLAIEALAASAEVESIYLDSYAHASTGQGVPLVGGSTAVSWGYTGAGVVVAVIDTGIDTDHVHFAGAIVAEACYCDEPGGNPNDGCCPGNLNEAFGTGAAEDDAGHGTAVSGVITAHSGMGNGVAPGAQIAAVKVLDNNGTGLFSDIAKGLDWVLTNRISLGIKVVNLSLGDQLEHNNPAASPCSGTLDAIAIGNLVSNGVAVFAASGNQGFDNGISRPACASSAISVGGSYDSAQGTVNWCGGNPCPPYLCTDTGTTADSFVCHTNSSSLLDLVAPDWKTQTTSMGGGSAFFSGTSAASPYAAGMAAILLQADDSLTSSQIKTLLATQAPLVTNSDNGLSFPRARVDVGLSTLIEICGNGILDPGEQCDDNNTSPGDCCSATCQYETAGSSCSDGNACTQNDSCDAVGTCQGGGALGCDDSNLCTDDSCNSGSGCVFAPNTDPCDDGDACTENDACGGGTCQGGGALGCDDSNLCTDDSCNSGSGCVFTPNTDPCSDGNACTANDACSGGACQSGGPLGCDDSNLCTDDSCNSGSGCVFTPNTDPCSDGDTCTENDACSGGACASGSALDCDDLDVCTADSCDSISGCHHEIIPGCRVLETPGLSGLGLIMMSLCLLAVGLNEMNRRAFIDD